jgi:hypothetical protein
VLKREKRNVLKKSSANYGWFHNQIRLGFLIHPLAGLPRLGEEGPGGGLAVRRVRVEDCFPVDRNQRVEDTPISLSFSRDVLS